VSYLLDTNVVSALRRRDRAEKRVLEWFQRLASAEFFVSVLTMMEIETGIRRLERHDSRQAAVIRAWKEGPLEIEFRGRFIDVSREIAERCSALHVPDPQPEIDALIAATAIVKRLKLVTRNERDFAGMPVAVLNPWSSAEL
jgi:predicted nucleic acid-binding protein